MSDGEIIAIILGGLLGLAFFACCVAWTCVLPVVGLLYLAGMLR